MTVSTAARNRGRPALSSPTQIGASANASRTASASGLSTSAARYMNPMIAKIRNVTMIG